MTPDAATVAAWAKALYETTWPRAVMWEHMVKYESPDVKAWLAVAEKALTLHAQAVDAAVREALDAQCEDHANNCCDDWCSQCEAGRAVQLRARREGRG